MPHSNATQPQAAAKEAAAARRQLLFNGLSPASDYDDVMFFCCPGQHAFALTSSDTVLPALAPSAGMPPADASETDEENESGATDNWRLREPHATLLLTNRNPAAMLENNLEIERPHSDINATGRTGRSMSMLAQTHVLQTCRPVTTVRFPVTTAVDVPDSTQAGTSGTSASAAPSDVVSENTKAVDQMAKRARDQEAKRLFQNMFDAEHTYYPAAVLAGEAAATAAAAKQLLVTPPPAQGRPRRSFRRTRCKRSSSGAAKGATAQQAPVGQSNRNGEGHAGGATTATTAAGTVRTYESPLSRNAMRTHLDGCDVLGGTFKAAFIRARWLSLLLEQCALHEVSREATQVAANLFDRCHSMWACHNSGNAGGPAIGGAYGGDAPGANERMRVEILACLGLAATLVEIYPPTNEQLVEFMECSYQVAKELRAQDARAPDNVKKSPLPEHLATRMLNVTAAQTRILQQLAWRMNPPTLNFWVTAFVQDLDVSVECNTEPPVCAFQEPAPVPAPGSGSSAASAESTPTVSGPKSRKLQCDSSDDEATKVFLATPPSRARRVGHQQGGRSSASTGSSGKAGRSRGGRGRSARQSSPAKASPPSAQTRQSTAAALPVVHPPAREAAGWARGSTPREREEYQRCCQNLRGLLLNHMGTLCLLHPKSLEFRPSVLAFCLVTECAVVSVGFEHARLALLLNPPKLCAGGCALKFSLALCWGG